jgi:sporulation protein YlmC with PRC-barrel domain
MIRIFLPLICAALGLAAASCNQSEGPLPPAEAPASPHATSHGAASAAMESPPDKTAGSDFGRQQAPQASPPEETSTPPDAQASAASQSVANASADAPTSAPAERRASTLIGMPVVSAGGSPLGQVKDIIFDREGQATHLVIAYTVAPEGSPAEVPDDGKSAASPDGKLTAMPWDAAVASMKEGRLVLDGAKLQGAPSFTPDAWPNLDDPGWSATADAYWRKAVRAAIAAHPGAPIDSTERQRARPTRDGDDGDGD